MDDVTLQSLFGRAPGWVESEDLSAGAAGGRRLGATAYKHSVAVVQTLDDVFAKIDGDRDLSDDGKAKKKSRAVKDAGVALGKVAGYQEKLAKEGAKAQEAVRPRVAGNDAVSAAIWPRLPADQAAVRTLYRDALAASDWHTANAVESLPSVFDGRLDADTLAELKRERLQAEAPEALAALEQAEETLATVDGALHAATEHVAEAGRGLPDPDDGGDVKVGDDGLRQLSPSQFAEAASAA